MHFSLDAFEDSIEFTILPKALSFYNTEQTDTLQYIFTKQKEKDVGKLIITADTLFKTGILELLFNNKVVQTATANTETKEIAFKNLQAGSYTFRFVIDSN
jgi:hypothetical protein